MSDPLSAEAARSSDAAQDVFLDFLLRRSGGETIDIDALCSARPAMATQLRVLWEQHERELARDKPGGGTLARELRDRFGDEAAPEVSLAPGDESDGEAVIGDVDPHGDGSPKGTRYRVVGEIARGGMGAVYKAWDADLRRHLAMKVALHRTTSSPPTAAASNPAATLGRFLEEAQITGQLDHPGIVPVHEIGLDADGRLFFTMRLVKGRDLKRIFEISWKGEEGWTLTRVVHVLLKVCEALAYAHAKGVIHRDLKPSNVMVGRFGEVYVMDWGVARVLGQKDRHDLRLKTPEGTLTKVNTNRREHASMDPESSLVTMDGEVLGTPAYMSPEQARSDLEQLSPRSDVYSVGAMLYHLLARQPPYLPPGMRVSPWMVLMRVVEEPPKSLAELNAAAPPELVAICEKAMSRKPEDRYATTLEMKSDLEAYLENRVVRAYETGVAAEVRKWTLRNKALAAAIGLVVLSTVSGLAYNLYREAENSRELEKKNTALLAETERANLSATRATAAAETSKAVVEFLSNMFRSQDPGNSRGETLTVKQALAEATNRIEPSFKSKPEVKAYVLQSIGQVYMSLSLNDEAEAMLVDSLATYRTLPGRTTLEMLVALNSLGVQRMVRSDVDGARAYFEEELALAERDFGDHSEEALRARFHLVRVCLEERKFEEAESLCLQIVELRRAEGEAKAADLAGALEFLATTHRFQAQHAQAEDALIEAITIRERLGPADDAALLAARGLLGSLYQSQRQYDDARKIYESMLALQRAKLADDDPDVLTTRWLIAGLLEAQGQLAQAEAIYEQVHAGRSQKLGERSGLTAAAQQSLTIVRSKRAALEQAAQEQAQALEGLRATLAPADPRIAELALELIDSYLKLERPQDALPLARELAERAEPGSAAASERRALLHRVEQAVGRKDGR